MPDSDWPALVIELKWNESAEGAIDQILNRRYPSVLKNIDRSILLVGITYDKNAGVGKRKHSCKIIEYVESYPDKDKEGNERNLH